MKTDLAPGFGMESNKGRGSLTSYLVALLAPAVIAVVMQVTWPFFQQHPVQPYLLAVIFCAWYGGLGPGVLSTVISFLLADFFFIEPYIFFRFPKQANMVSFLIFAAVGSFISVMSELMHRERRRAEINLESAKRAEESLRGKERFVNQIAELSPVVINVLDLATRRDVYISPDVVNLLGYTPKEIAEMENPMSVLWHPEDIPRGRENLSRLKHATDGEIAEFEYRIRRRDGEWRWVASRSMPFDRDENGVVRQIVTASLDITERKRVEWAQKESQLQYETLVQSIDGIVWEADPRTFTFSFVSKQAERILGYPLEQWFEGPDFWPDHMHTDDRDWAVAFCVDATARGVDHQFEYRMIAADGRVVWLSDIVTLHVVDDQSVVLRGLMVDITDRKLFEEKLRATTQQLRALSASLQFAREEEGTRIAREIHDELGAALSSLRWDLEGVDEAISKSGNGSQPEELRKKIAAMMRLTDTTINVVRRVSSELRPIALDDLGLTEAIDWQARQFQDRTGIIVQCDCTLDNPDLSREQSTAVFRIFQEALTNILRHAQAMRVTVLMEVENGEFILTISDNGRGITDDEKSGQHTLGLLGMRERAHLIGAKIDITGSDGKGTVVSVRTPISGKRVLGSVA